MSTATEPQHETREIPAGAMQCAAGVLTLDPKVLEQDPDSIEIPVELLARTKQPIDHWWWGRLVHDFAGMRHKERVSVDDRHDWDAQLGFVDEFDLSTGDLVTRGKLIRDPEDSADPVRKIVHKASHGVPYEASIDWRGQGVVIEEVSVGASVQVNGYTIEGPCTVVRQWPLTAIAITPHGGDPNTETRLSDESDQIKVTVRKQGVHEMPQSDQPKETPDKPDNETLEGQAGDNAPDAAQVSETPPAETPEAPDAAGDGNALESEGKSKGDGPGKRYLEAFGDRGGRYYAEGKNWTEALEAEVSHLQGEIKSRDEKIDALEKKLGAVDRGDTIPAGVQPADAGDNKHGGSTSGKSKLSASLGDKLGAYAESLELAE